MYKDFIKKNYKILLDILNCLKVGVYITDGDGNTVFLNDESCKTGGLTREEVLGKNMAELEEMGFVENSVTLRTLESGKEEDIIQNLGDGDKVFVTGTPLYYGDDGIDLIDVSYTHLEYDEEETEFQKISDDTYVIDGSMDLDDLDEELGVDLESENSETCLLYTSRCV